MTYQLYWGDLHSHCSISYGHGTVQQALARARQQLDFCSITGHAFWPDMPDDRERYAEIIDYHTDGFARLARNWPKLIDELAAANRPGEFITFPSYEWHSLHYGDHNVYAPGPQLALRGACDLPALRNVAIEAGGIAIPHHIGYAAGYRGIDWRHFDASRSPFVEIYSLHGCSLSDDAPYPMLHDMGPRDAGSTAEAGWKLGRRFGIVGGSDHHGAYPGSHGDGRMGVFAASLSREALWEAFLARRVFAATGDRIDARLFVEGAWVGSEIVQPGARQIRIEVTGSDALDHVDLIRNGKLVRRFSPPLDRSSSDGPGDQGDPTRYRLRVTWGWGRKNQIVRWMNSLSLSEGTIVGVETCFSGQPIVAPQTQSGDAEVPDVDDLPHSVVERTTRRCAWRSITSGNPTMRHATTQAISFDIEAPATTRIVVETVGGRFEHSLADLLDAGRSHYLRGWLSEAICIGPAVPALQCQSIEELTEQPESDTDVYRLEVAQKNGQWAWTSPIWVCRR